MEEQSIKYRNNNINEKTTMLVLDYKRKKVAVIRSYSEAWYLHKTCTIRKGNTSKTERR